MERSLTARLARPLGFPLLRGGAGSGSKGRSSAKPSSRGGLRILEAPAAALSFLWRGRRTRIALIAVLVAVPVLAGGFLALRHSSFVAVERVRISGVHGAEAPAIEAALVAAAHHMSTLDVKAGALSAAVAPFRVVSSIRAVASFPHGLRIQVQEQLPVAALVVNGARTAVAADGVVLGPALLAGSLPTVTGYLEPLAGQRLHSATLLEWLAVLGAAPRLLARHVERVYNSAEGLTVAMHNGLLVYFGDAVRPHAKWFSLARVLADHSSSGASYVDVRLPARPAAGFPAGAGPASSLSSEESGSSETTAGSSSESTVGALAAGLAKEGGTGTTATATEEPSSTSTSESSTEASEEQPSESSQTPSTSSPESTTEAPTAGG